MSEKKNGYSSVKANETNNQIAAHGTQSPFEQLSPSKKK